ncbi:hypothetical protein PV458_07890 [Streptomyces sp. MN03-5084-2B]|nr:hypothetical protein [Streptomyces sp. MN03-5084-2B]
MLAFAMAIAFTAGVANATTSGPAEHFVTHKVISKITLGFTKLKGASTRSVDDDPPPVCNEQVQLAVTAGYIDDVLAETVSHYAGQVYCPPADDFQTMRHLSDNAQLAIGSEIVQQANLGECSHEPGQSGQCVAADSADEYSCTAGTGCAGEYQAGNFYTELLPDGWIWTQIPDGCQLLGESEIICRDFTQPIINISPIY